MLRVICILLVCLVSIAHAAEDSYDSYDFQNRCPQEGKTAEDNFNTNSYYLDGRNFPICQCTSYVAFKLNEHWGPGAPRFTNQYYSHNRWGHAYEWLDRAIDSEIGITGARDNFTWDENAYNAVFIGDVALWERRGTGAYSYGHVAYVEDVEKPSGVWNGCVTYSQYNVVKYDFNRVRVCRTSDRNNPDYYKFPDYFLHIDQDRSYCLRPENRETGSCRTLNAGTRVANGSRQKYIGGLGGSSTPFNLAVNRFWVRDAATGTDLDPSMSLVRIAQVLQPRIQVKAKDGDTHDHMRPGKDRIEVDLYARLDSGDWFFLKREYIQATNLPSGSTHTEHVDYTVPPGVQTLSFKAKIDAEDEASESNEGDNWTEIQTFSVASNIPTSPTSLTITVTD